VPLVAAPTPEPGRHSRQARARRPGDGSRGEARVEGRAAARRSLATRFFSAAEEGDLQGLEELLTHDVVFRGDGGGKAPAAARALHGRVKVARALTRGFARLQTLLGGFRARREEINGEPGALFFDREGRLAGVIILDIADGQIQAVNSIVNPDKLTHLGPVADLRSLLRSAR
jgi:hypothetical protein